MIMNDRDTKYLFRCCEQQGWWKHKAAAGVQRLVDDAAVSMNTPASHHCTAAADIVSRSLTSPSLIKTNFPNKPRRLGPGSWVSL